MSAKWFSVIAAVVAIGFTAGCSNSQPPPPVADIAAQAQKAREANQNLVDSIRSNPALSTDQKNQMIARISRGRVTAPSN